MDDTGEREEGGKGDAEWGREFVGGEFERKGEVCALDEPLLLPTLDESFETTRTRDFRPEEEGVERGGAREEDMPLRMSRRILTVVVCARSARAQALVCSQMHSMSYNHIADEASL